MNTSAELWGYISAFIIFVCGFFIASKVSRYFGLKKSHSVFLYFWHTLFCLVYFWYASWNISDSTIYYYKSTLGDVEFWPGTPGVVLINTPFIYGLNLSFLGAFALNNIYGFIGLAATKGALDIATRNKNRFLKYLAWVIVLLPSISFWSSAISKDSISFMATGLALWAALQLEKRVFIMAFAIFMMFLVRPHIAGMMILALSFSLILSAKINLFRRLLLGSVAVVVTVVLVPFALQYAGVSDQSSAEAVIDYIDSREAGNMGGGSSIDITSMSLPMKLFTYAFRPSVLEARNIFYFAAAIDNFILLILFVSGGYAFFKKKTKNLIGNRTFMWAYVFLAWIILAMTTANLGIAVRQKWMFAPMLIFLLISLIGKERNPTSAVTPAAPATRLPRGSRFK